MNLLSCVKQQRRKQMIDHIHEINNTITTSYSTLQHGIMKQSD